MLIAMKNGGRALMGYSMSVVTVNRMRCLYFYLRPEMSSLWCYRGAKMRHFPQLSVDIGVNSE